MLKAFVLHIAKSANNLDIQLKFFKKNQNEKQFAAFTLSKN